MTPPPRTRVALSLPEVDLLLELLVRAAVMRAEVAEDMPALSDRERRAFTRRQKQLDRVAKRLRSGRDELEATAATMGDA